MIDPIPTPVTIAGPKPVPVEVTNPAKAAAGQEHVQRQATDPSLPAQTTFQQDLTTAGQRHINVMWEGTQRNIALMVTGIVLAVCAFLTIFGTIYGKPDVAVPAFMLLSNVFFLVVGTYFQRTNHTKTGGVGFNETGR